MESGTAPPDFGFGSEETFIQLSDLRLIYRVLLAFCPNGFDAGCLKGIHAASDEWEGFQDREMVAILVSAAPPDELIEFAEKEDVPFVLVSDEDNVVTSLYGADGSQEPIVYLLGKDGMVKKVWVGWPANSEIFDLVDTMLLRQQEIQERSEAA